MPDYFDDNPMGLDSNEDVREAVRGAGGNPMDIGTQEQATFALSLLNAWENDDDRPQSRRESEVFAAESEMVIGALENDYGVEVDDPPEFDDEPDWYL
jgi:hypothetical protein